METNKKAVVLLSGGVDSTTTLAHAMAGGYECYALSFDYGQRHHIELNAARMVAKTLGAKEHLVIKLDMRGIGGSALTDDIDVPKEPSAPDEIPITYVPARNTIFLSCALGWAETLRAPDIFIGANAVDYSGYPDCRPEYLQAFERMANLATKIAVEGEISFSVKAPLLMLSKSDIIRRGIELGVDYSMTISCYDPSDDGTPCGLCDSCRIREKGMLEALGDSGLT
jgi:7-cyano-7-deazaguanine synthase